MIRIRPVSLFLLAALSTTMGQSQTQNLIKDLEFKPVESNSPATISRVTTYPPRCSGDGTLFIDMLDLNDLRRHTVVSARHNKITNISPSAISDLNDILVLDSFPTDSGVDFLIRASKELPSGPGRGKSPAGIVWDTYHNFVAKFDADGAYRGSTQLSVIEELSHFAVLSTGDFLVVGYNHENSTLRVLYLRSSGDMVRSISIPASKRVGDGTTAIGGVDPFGVPKSLLGSIFLTRYDKNILIWRRNSNDPIIEIGSGGTQREVSLQMPSGYTFADMITSNSRWIVHLHATGVPQDAPLTLDTDPYYEIRPRDGTVYSKLNQKGIAPLSLACETDGEYLAFLRGENGELMLVSAK